jgi:hypothetical protein
MELNLSSEEAAFRDEVRAFIAENYPADGGAGSRGKTGDSAERRHRADRLRRETNVQTAPYRQTRVCFNLAIPTLGMVS